MTRSRLTTLLTAALLLLAALVGAVAPAASAVPTTPLRPAPRRPRAAASTTARPVGRASAPAACSGATCRPAATPALWSLLQDGASAALTVRSVTRQHLPGRRLADPVGR